MGQFKTVEWISWIGAGIVTTAIVITFAYAQFESKDHAKETRNDIQAELTEIKGDVKTILLTMPRK